MGVGTKWSWERAPKRQNETRVNNMERIKQKGRKQEEDDFWFYPCRRNQ